VWFPSRYAMKESPGQTGPGFANATRTNANERPIS
jgi:hypothetical protein